VGFIQLNAFVATRGESSFFGFASIAIGARGDAMNSECSEHALTT